MDLWWTMLGALLFEVIVFGLCCLVIYSLLLAEDILSTLEDRKLDEYKDVLRSVRQRDVKGRAGRR